MKDEIKEILNLFKDESVNGFIISDEIYQNLKDYITNLQIRIDKVNKYISKVRPKMFKHHNKPAIYILKKKKKIIGGDSND